MPIAGGGLPIPEFHVELGFTAQPFDALSTVAWTDVTQLCKGLEGGAGRNHELSRTEPGRGSLVLNNNDGRFDPTNTASPYYPNLTPMRRARLRAVWSGIAYPIWTGYVDTFHPTWASETSSEVTLPLADVLDLLGRTPIASTVYRDTILADHPSRYYRLGEDLRSTIAVDSSNRHISGAYFGTVTLGTQGPLVTDSDTAADFGSNSGHVDTPSYPTSDAYSWECWLRSTATDPGMALEADNSHAGGTNQLDIESTGGTITAVFLGSGGAISALASTKHINEGNWHHVVWTRNAATTTYKLYIDGVLDTSGTAVATPIPAGLTLGIARRGDHGSFWSGSIDEVAVYSYELTAAQVLAHYNAGVGAWANQLTGQRANAVLDAIGFPAADRVIDPGNTLLASVTSSLADTMALAHLQDVANTEDGLLFVDRAGRICFYDRHRALVAPNNVSQATFGDGAADPLHYVRGGLDVAPDRDDLRNIITGKRGGGEPLMVVDAASKAAYGPSRDDVGTLLSATDYDVWDRLNWTLSHYGQPAERVRKMTFRPWTDHGAGWPQALGAELHDRITVKHKANGGGSTFSQESLIEGRHVRWSPPDVLEADFNLSVADAAGPWWVLGTAALGVSTRLAY